jgi:hypothetical protein
MSPSELDSTAIPLLLLAEERLSTADLFPARIVMARIVSGAGKCIGSKLSLRSALGAAKVVNLFRSPSLRSGRSIGSLLVTSG